MSQPSQLLQSPQNDLSSQRVLDIGCGRNKLAGAIGLDWEDLPGVDIIANLNEPLPVEDESFDVVHAEQVLEHVERLIELVYEVHRILKPGGIFLVHVPYFRSSWAHIDPTHVRCFTLQSMNYFVEETYEYQYYRFRDAGFKKVEIELDNHISRDWKHKLLQPLAFRDPARYENSFLSNLFPFQRISYTLTK
jgi:SAM-dependent methyltransferase